MIVKKNVKKLSRDDWYYQQAIRAVNQSIGRIIRHKNDYSVVLLLGERFAQQKQINNLSIWIQSFVHICEHFSEAQQGDNLLY